MEDVSNLIIWRLDKIVEDGDHRQLQFKHKAITAFLPYAVWRERDGQPEMLDAYLRATRALRERQPTWDRMDAIKLLSVASPRATVLVSPHIRWGALTGRERSDSVDRWATAASEVPYTEEVGQSVVEVLFQIASEGGLAKYIPTRIWSWLTRRPPLPFTRMGRYAGTRASVVEAIRELGNVEVLKSYFLLIWSELGDLWDNSGFDKMCASIREAFSGIRMGQHRAELTQRLDHVLGQLDQGLEYLHEQNPQLGKSDLRRMKRRYKKLKEVLSEVERRTSPPMATVFRILTPRLIAWDLFRRLCPLSLSRACSFFCRILGRGRSTWPFICTDACDSRASPVGLLPVSRNVRGVYVTFSPSTGDREGRSKFVAFRWTRPSRVCYFASRFHALIV